MFFLIRLSGVVFMLCGITDVILRRFFDIHIFNIAGSAYLAGLLGIILVEISAFSGPKRTQRWNHDR